MSLSDWGRPNPKPVIDDDGTHYSYYERACDCGGRLMAYLASYNEHGEVRFRFEHVSENGQAKVGKRGDIAIHPSLAEFLDSPVAVALQGCDDFACQVHEEFGKDVWLC